MLCMYPGKTAKVTMKVLQPEQFIMLAPSLSISPMNTE
jgi:hypothetical protein